MTFDTLSERDRARILRMIGKRPRPVLRRTTFRLWFEYARTLAAALEALRLALGRPYRGSRPDAEDSVRTLSNMIRAYENHLAGLRSDGETLAGSRHSNVGLLPKSIGDPLRDGHAVEYAIKRPKGKRPQVIGRRIRNAPRNKGGK